MKNKIYKICKDIIKITEEEIAECRGIYKEQLAYNHPLKMATVKNLNDLGRYNRKVIQKIIELKTILENGSEVEIKDDMRDRINKAIEDYENNLKHETGKEIKLTDREKELVEYGYMQAGLDMDWCIHKSREEMKEQTLKWIPFVSEYDEEEQQEMLQGQLPENEQEILVTDGQSVWADTFMNECECYLDSGCDLVATVVAWMPLPEPYKS